jgi:hypothetical protein
VQDHRHTKAAGFDHHLVKPVDPNVLQTVLGVRKASPETPGG